MAEEKIIGFKLVMDSDNTRFSSLPSVDKALCYIPYEGYDYYDLKGRGCKPLVRFGGKGGYKRKGGTECCVCLENKPNAYTRWCPECSASMCGTCYHKVKERCPMCRTDMEEMTRGLIPQRVRNGERRNIYKDVEIIEAVDICNKDLEKITANIIKTNKEKKVIEENNEEMKSCQEYRNIVKESEVLDNEVKQLQKLLRIKEVEYYNNECKRNKWLHCYLKDIPEEDDASFIMEFVKIAKNYGNENSGSIIDGIYTWNLCDTQSYYYPHTILRGMSQVGNHAFEQGSFGDIWELMELKRNGNQVIVHKGDKAIYQANVKEKTKTNMTKMTNTMSKAEKLELMKALQDSINDE